MGIVLFGDFWREKPGGWVEGKGYAEDWEGNPRAQAGVPMPRCRGEARRVQRQTQESFTSRGVVGSGHLRGARQSRTRGRGSVTSA